MITDKELLTALLSAKNIKYFWKDDNRRFLGASQSFLDYYGFSSMDMILGRNDEDMGWHIDPDPYRDDEYLVIKEGRAVYDRPGTCIIRGQIHHIQATKVPIIGEDGEIKGLVGFFEDVTDTRNENERLKTIVNTDPVTGLINRNGFYSSVEAYIEEYNKREVDFVAFYINIDNFKEANEEYNHGFGDRLLKAVAEDMKRVAGSDSVIASFGGDDFVILHQLADPGELTPISKSVWDIHDKLVSALTDIHYIDGHSYRPAISIGFASFSETGSVLKLIEIANSNMTAERRAKKKHRRWFKD
ncbi:MAG: diguanylate cyclase [Lachnospiraceae bacterium]|nr:diguanylate cyclase [Lachnospiraceae bacterium]